MTSMSSKYPKEENRCSQIMYFLAIPSKKCVVSLNQSMLQAQLRLIQHLKIKKHVDKLFATKPEKAI